MPNQSDDKVIDFTYGELKELQKRISELEKKENRDYENINELRRQINEIDDEDHGYIQSLEKEIAELREMQETIVGTDPVRMEGAIDELKEHLKSMIDIDADNQNRIITTEEVLRELGKEIVGYFQGDFRENEIEAIDLMCKNINRLLEKLDSQGKTERPPLGILSNMITEKETEKKEFNPNCEGCTSLLCVGCICNKASGGEYPPEFICRCGKRFVPYHDGLGMQTGFCADCLTKYDTVGLDDLGSEKTDLGNECPKEDDALSKVADSKPPEPKFCYKCIHEICASCEDREHFSPIEDRLPGGTGIVVKREDLKWMLTELPYSLDATEDMKNMDKAEKLKEEYNL